MYLSESTSAYRDGVFSAATPAPRYGSLTTVFENGSLGDDSGDNLDVEAAALLDGALDETIGALDPAALAPLNLPPPALAAAAVAVALCKQAQQQSDVQQKLITATAASYSATFFGLPRNTLLYTVERVCSMYAMTAYQRRAFHQAAARLLDQYVAHLKKGNAMSGVFQATAIRDGSLGGAYRDGVLGVYQNGAFRDGSLGLVRQNGAFQDGSLGAPRAAYYSGGRLAYRRVGALKRPLRGLGCGCSGVGDDAAVTPAPTPFYKQPLVIGGAAVALGVILYAVTKK